MAFKRSLRLVELGLQFGRFRALGVELPFCLLILRAELRDGVIAAA